MDFWVRLVGNFFEALGVLALLVGTLWALLSTFRRWRAGEDKLVRSLRRSLGKAILLGLELLVAADIVRTVSARPELEEVVVLGLVVLIRTFLSFSLEMELEGHWPWQTPRDEDPPA